MPILHIADTATGEEVDIQVDFTSFAVTLFDAAKQIEKAVARHYNTELEDSTFHTMGFEPVVHTETTLVAHSVPDSYWGSGETLKATIK